MKKQTTVMLGILTTLGELNSGAPAGHLYAGLMAQVTYTEFTDALIMLVDNGLANQRGDHYVTLTAKGRALAAKVNAELAKARAEREAAAKGGA